MDKLKQQLNHVKEFGPISRVGVELWWNGYCDGKGLPKSIYDMGMKLIDKKFKK